MIANKTVKLTENIPLMEEIQYNYSGVTRIDMIFIRENSNL